MAEVVRFESEDGAFMLVEAELAQVGPERDVGLVTKKTDGVATAATKLEDSLGSVRGAAVALMNTVNDMKQRADAVTLDEVSMELALSFSVEGGVVVAKGSATAQASVTLKWRSGKTG
jgi:hypothetical protein